MTLSNDQIMAVFTPCLKTYLQQNNTLHLHKEAGVTTQIKQLEQSEPPEVLFKITPKIQSQRTTNSSTGLGLWANNIPITHNA